MLFVSQQEELVKSNATSVPKSLLLGASLTRSSGKIGRLNKNQVYVYWYTILLVYYFYCHVLTYITIQIFVRISIQLY